MSRVPQSSVRRFHLVWAFALGLIMAILSVGPVGAYSNVVETGMVGQWSLNDTSSTPGAVCNYGPQYSPDFAGMRWMSVKPPVVFAADRNSNKVDHKTVKWSWKLQRGHYPNNGWRTIATSAVQTATAYDNKAAHFSALRINHNVGNPNISDVIYRALVVIKWIKADGSVEGTAKATIDWYKGKLPWGNSVFASSYCQEVETAG